jgi:hypothetical protein
MLDEVDAMAILVPILEARFGATVQERNDGIDVRYWKLQVLGGRVALRADEAWGTTLEALDRAGESAVRAIAKELNEELRLRWCP